MLPFLLHTLTGFLFKFNRIENLVTLLFSIDGGGLMVLVEVLMKSVTHFVGNMLQ